MAASKSSLIRPQGVNTMDIELPEITMISMIKSSDYRKGRLSLACPFWCEYGKLIPTKLIINVNSLANWEGMYNTCSPYITSLHEIYSFYGIKPYHYARIKYAGDAQFILKFYSPYATEIKYPFDTPILENNVTCTDIEKDRLSSVLDYNASFNFVGVYDLVVERRHVVVDKYVQVFTEAVCNELNLTESVKFIVIGFSEYEWNIKFKLVNREGVFSKNWFRFVEAANISADDIVTFYKTSDDLRFKICIFEKDVVVDCSSLRERSCYANFFKEIEWDFLEDGEMQYAHNLGHNLHIELDGGNSAKLKYNSATNRLYGLKRFFGKYSIRGHYIIFFNYMGNSTFNVSVYNFDNMDHLQDISGNLKITDIVNPPSGTEVILLESENEDC